MDSFAPSVLIDGKTVKPKGCVWILGFAIAGCEWAIEVANKPEFLDRIREDLRQEEIKKLNSLIDQYKLKIKKLEIDLDD